MNKKRQKVFFCDVTKAFDCVKHDTRHHEQHINMKFCFKLQKSAKETHKMLKLVYGDAAVTMKMVYKWFERFHNGCESVQDEERSGHPSTSTTQENVERVSEMI